MFFKNDNSDYESKITKIQLCLCNFCGPRILVETNVMPEKKQLFISSPCHKQWGNMQPDNEGLFCGACSKTVVDFTMMSDPEMLAWFARADKDVCGRFTDDQLNRDLSPAKPPKRNRWAVLNFLLAGLLVSSEVSAQEKPPKAPTGFVEKVGDRPQVTLGKVRMAPEDTSHITLKVVEDIKGAPIPWTTLQIGEKKFSTDANGSCTIPRKDMLKGQEIILSSVGYAKKIVTINNHFLQSNSAVIILAERMITMGEVITVVRKSKRKAWIPLTDTGKVVRCIKDTLLCIKKPLTVYPNPVVRGASVTLSLQMDQPGNYMAQLFSSSGALVESMHIEGVDGPRTELLEIPGTLAAGMYFIKLFNTQTGKLYKEKVMVL